MNREKFAILVKAKSDFHCRVCGSTNLVMAHDPTGKHENPDEGIALCADCHSNEHPNVPRQLFFSENRARIWVNISATSIADEVGCCSRTIIRRAKKLAIPLMGKLSEDLHQRLAAERFRFEFHSTYVPKERVWGGNPGGKWKQEEITELKSLFNEIPLLELSYKLDRSPGAILYMAYKLGANRRHK